MTIFGVPFDELDAGRLQAHLEQAGDEPLLWEAKGTEVHRNEVLRQVCGFANSHEGGYLILGATPSAATEGDEGEKRWELNGVKFSDEPRTWISNVVTDPERGVRPRPDFDVVAWPAPGGHVAVVRVSPTSTPPCIANGTIYERVPGKTQTVRDPQILAGLFSRGDQARRDAQGRADRAAIALIQNWLPEGSAEFRQQTWVPDAEEDRAVFRSACKIVPRIACTCRKMRSRGDT